MICPECKKEVFVEAIYNEYERNDKEVCAHVGCDKCYVYVYAETKRKAINKWNRIFKEN